MGFTSFLKAIGHDFKLGLRYLLPIAETAGQIAVDTFAPGLGPMFHSTVVAVALAEQKAEALGANNSGSGVSKLADVIQLMEPVIAQGLKDAGKDSSTAGVTSYINSVVTILNAIPAPSQTPPAA